MRVSRGGVFFRIAVTAFLFVLACAARGAASETLPPDFTLALVEADMRRLLTANWFHVSTQNAGSLSLPPWWEVVSKDEPPERSPEADVMLHVQQVLYARANEPSADSGAELQIFSIWRADRNGKIFPLPDTMLEQINGDFVANLIDARYGNVTYVAEEAVYTKLDELSVVTYGAAPGDPGVDPRTLRYKRAALFYGDKQVLVLMKYSPDHEKYWQGELEMLLDIWVASLALTPRPLSEMAKAMPMPLPDFPPEILPEIVPLPPRLALVPNAPVLDSPGSSGAFPIEETKEDVMEDIKGDMKEETAESFAPPLASTPAVSADSLPVLSPSPVNAQAQRGETGDDVQRGPAELYAKAVPLLLCAMLPIAAGAFFKIARVRRRRGQRLFNEQGSMLAEPLLSADFAYAVSSTDSVSELEEEILLGKIGEETAFVECEEVDKEELDRELDLDGELDEVENPIANSTENSEEETGTETGKEAEDLTASTQADAEALVLSLLEEISQLEEKAQERQIAEAEKMGFDKVYSLLNEALLNIDSDLQIAGVFVPRRRMPNLKETAAVLDGLEEMFGASCVMDSLKDEVFKALELNAGTPILQTKEVALDRFILKLCSGTLLRMLQTGRYHVGRGILGSEGQELLELFHRINDLRAQKAYSTPEEAGRDFAFIQYCMKELG